MRTERSTRLARSSVVAAAAMLAGCLYPPATGVRMEVVPDVVQANDVPDAAHAHDVQTGPPIPMFHQCTEAMFVDRTGATAERKVTFGMGAVPFSYNPPCMIVAAGQTVRFEGTFATHPLEHGISAAEPNAGSPNTPIPRQTEGTMVDVTFPTAGTYPFFCQMHFLAGMTGVVHVR